MRRPEATEQVHERLSTLGQRIAVVGGGGKSALARATANAIGVPHLELDSMFWKPGGVESEGNEFKARVADALRSMDGGWVCDGNYLRKLGDLVVSQADTVIFVNMPWRVMFRRVFVRGIVLAFTGRQICGSNQQTWSHLISGNSLIWWHIKNRRKYLDRPSQVQRVTPTDTRLIQMNTPRQLNEFYMRFGVSRA